jgi:hypothetical protein
MIFWPSVSTRARCVTIAERAFHFVLRSGAAVTIPVALIRELAEATPAQLAAVKLYPTGGAIEQRELDVDISVPVLLRDVLGFPAGAGC